MPLGGVAILVSIDGKLWLNRKQKLSVKVNCHEKTFCSQAGELCHLTGVCLITYFAYLFLGYLCTKKFKYSILKDFILVIRQSDGPAIKLENVVNDWRLWPECSCFVRAGPDTQPEGAKHGAVFASQVQSWIGDTCVAVQSFVRLWNYQGIVILLTALARSRFKAYRTIKGARNKIAKNRDEFFNFIVRVSCCIYFLSLLPIFLGGQLCCQVYEIWLACFFYCLNAKFYFTICIWHHYYRFLRYLSKLVDH